MKKYTLLIGVCSLCLHIVCAQNLLLFDGKIPNPSTCAFFYGEADSLEAFAGNYCFNGTLINGTAPVSIRNAKVLGRKIFQDMTNCATISRPPNKDSPLK
jgi:hypothetical protein